MREGDTIQELRKERAYLSEELEEATKELARLDLLNLTLTRQKKQAMAAFHFIKVLHEKLEKAFTIDDLYRNVVKVLTSELFMDSSALLKVNVETGDISLLASVGLPENIKVLKLDKSISKKELLDPTFVNSNSSLQPIHKFIRDRFKFPYSVWYPIGDEEGGTLVLFVGNKVEDLVSKQPFSEASLETLGAISSVILLRRDNIAKTQEMLRKKEERIDFLAEILKTSPISVVATDKDANITYCNPAAEKLYGYEKEELLGKDPGMLNAEPNAAEIQREILDTVRGGRVWRGEILNKKKNGDLLYTHASVYQLRDKEGNFIALVGFQEDITERKRVQDTLKESEDKYRTIFENTGTATIIIEENTTISLINTEFEKLTGYSKEEVEGKKSWTEFVMKDDLERLKEYHDVRRIDPSGAPRNYELKIMDRQGHIRDLFLTVGMIPGTKKSVASSLDITERKRSEEALRESENRYKHMATEFQALLNAISDVLTFQNPNLQLAWANSAAAESLDSSVEEIIGQHCYELWCKRQMPCDGCPTLKAMKTGKPSAAIKSTPDGRIWEISSYPVFDDQQKARGAVEVARDITEKKRMEEQLRKYANDLERMVSERTAELANTTSFLNNILDSSTEYAIVATNLKGTILNWNTGAKNIFGYDAEEVIGKANVDIFYERDFLRGKKKKNVLRAAIDAQTSNVDFGNLTLIRKNGESFPADLTATYLRDPQGTEIGILGIIKDVTVRKMLERQLIQSEKMAGIGTLAAGIAHEVRNPMSIINTSTYLLREGIIGKTVEIENLLEQIEGGMKRTQTIINDLLDFSRPAVRELESVDLKNLMEQILSLEGRVLSTQNIKLRSELKDVPKIMANLDSLKHIFLNLLINAVQSMPEGGTLGIKTYQEDKRVAVEISDTGIGIAEKDLSKIFDPFFTTKEPGKGTGLGLAFVHSEIERMRAKIRVESKPRLGSTFTVEFSLREHDDAG